MQQMTPQTPVPSPRLAFLLVFVGLLSLLCVDVAHAQAAAGGLSRANAFIQNVLVALRSLSIGVVTIAIMVAGYKFLFKHADIGECMKILGGGLLIGGAAELAAYIMA